MNSLSVFGQSGTIKGRVVNESGQPLPNVRVTLQPIGSFQRTPDAVTDREGNFQISDLEPLSYRVFAWLSTYVYSTNLDDLWSTSHRVGDSVTLVLTKGGVITGTVTTQTGEPVVGVRVVARMINMADSQVPQYLSPHMLERTTDDRGVYRIYGLATGTYVVWAGGKSEVSADPNAFDGDVPTYSPSSTRDTASEISVQAGQEVTNIDIIYRGVPGRIVSGSARRWDAGEHTGLSISLTAVAKSHSEWRMSTYLDANSKGFMFRGVDDGDYDVTVVSASLNGQSAIGSKRIKVKGADVTGIELIAQPLGSVSGRVVLEESKATECAGKQRPLFSETLVSASPDGSPEAGSHPQYRWFMGLPASPDAQGNVSIKNISTGRYFFEPQFRAKDWYLQSITLTPAAGAKTDASRTWTTVKSGERISGLTITLAQGGASLHGEVVLKEGETLPEKAFVYLVPAERDTGLDALRYFTSAVKADGKIALSSIAPGRYWVLVKSENVVTSVSKLRLPDQAEFRAKLRREAEAANTTVEFKPCQNVSGFELPLRLIGSVP
ncbi:MAG TPA: carboxypeptidase-like regulatory domain-containing protein [Pyrinomonadaceae bacterium]